MAYLAYDSLHACPDLLQRLTGALTGACKCSSEWTRQADTCGCRCCWYCCWCCCWSMAGPLVSLAPQRSVGKMHGGCNQTSCAYAAAFLTKTPGQCFVDKCAKTTNAKRSQHQQMRPESIIHGLYTDSGLLTGCKRAAFGPLPEPMWFGSKKGSSCQHKT